MRRGFVSGSSIALGITIGVFLVILPLFLQGFTIALWVPGASLISLLGGGGLHDQFGILFLVVGMLLDVLLYGFLAAFLIERVFSRKRSR
jgi:hypothetical protein